MTRFLAACASSALFLPLLAIASPAQAAGALSAEVSGGVLTITGSSRGDKIYVNFEQPTFVQISVSDQITWGSVTLTPGAGCRFSSFSTSFTDCDTAGVTRIVVLAGDGDDHVYTGVGWRSAAVGFSLPVEYHGGNGRDKLIGGPSDDLLYGEGSNDTQILGDKGDDLISGGEGDDVGMEGDGIGIDPSELGADVIDGGAGIDTLEGQRDILERTQFWSLDDVANDGSDLDDNPDNGAEEGDNILSTVENIVGTSDDDALVGSGADNVLNGGPGQNTIYGGSGGDSINIGYVGGQADGGPGDDEIIGGSETVVFGGDGTDTINAGGYIDAGPGMDDVTGSSANDVIVVTDGTIDQVNCREGADIVYADQVDVLATEYLCELEVGKVGTRKLLPGSIGLSVWAPGGGTLTVTVVSKNKVIGKPATIVTAIDAEAPVTVPLSAKERKSLAKLKSLPVTVRTSFTPRGATKPLAASRNVVLTR